MAFLPESARVALLKDAVRAAEPARRAAAMLVIDVARTQKTKAAFARQLKKVESQQTAEVSRELNMLKQRYGF